MNQEGGVDHDCGGIFMMRGLFSRRKLGKLSPARDHENFMLGLSGKWQSPNGSSAPKN